MGTRVTHERLWATVAHTCATHDDIREREFEVESIRHYENGAVLYAMTRCDGSPMNVWADGDSVSAVRA